MGVLDQMGSTMAGVIGGNQSSDLHTFLDRFSGSAGYYVETIDPLGTFEVNFKFQPCPTSNEKNIWGKLGGAFYNQVKQMGMAAADNLTGGLAGNFWTWLQNSEGFDKAKEDYSGRGHRTFLEYVVKYNQLQCGEAWATGDERYSPLELNIGPYVQKITGLNLQMHGEGKAESPGFQDFPVNGYAIKPSGELQMDIVNTKAALHERIFYPWMRECVNPWWSYQSQPYTTATVTVDFTKHNDVKYVFTGVRPKQIKLLDATQQADSGNITREVTFMYDFMFITSDMEVIDSVLSKLMGSAGALVSGAGKMLNM